jgi:N-acetylmuramoyl-L-alanine amidase
MKAITIIFDPAHGKDVKGKCSPDGRHKEYLWSRDRINNLVPRLKSLGYDVYVTTDSDNEPGLFYRKKFATQLKTGNRKLLISLHNNAAGSGLSWMSAQGVEVYTTPGVTDADVCSDIILSQFKKDFPEFKMRFYKDSYLERDKEASFTVLMGSGYMGILIEWLFQDNKDDVIFLADLKINRKFENSLVESIEQINEHFKS